MIGDIHQKIKFPILNGQQKEDQITAIVKLTPTNSNFWHFSIRWTDQQGKELNQNDASWKNKIVASIRAKLNEIYIATLPEPILIDVKEYS